MKGDVSGYFLIYVVLYSRVYGCCSQANFVPVYNTDKGFCDKDRLNDKRLFTSLIPNNITFPFSWTMIQRVVGVVAMMNV